MSKGGTHQGRRHLSIRVWVVNRKFLELAGDRSSDSDGALAPPPRTFQIIVTF